jgi:hypothetical protein
MCTSGGLAAVTRCPAVLLPAVCTRGRCSYCVHQWLRARLTNYSLPGASTSGYALGGGQQGYGGGYGGYGGGGGYSPPMQQQSYGGPFGGFPGWGRPFQYSPNAGPAYHRPEWPGSLPDSYQSCPADNAGWRWNAPASGCSDPSARHRLYRTAAAESGRRRDGSVHASARHRCGHAASASVHRDRYARDATGQPTVVGRTAAVYELPDVHAAGQSQLGRPCRSVSGLAGRGHAAAAVESQHASDATADPDASAGWLCAEGWHAGTASSATTSRRRLRLLHLRSRDCSTPSQRVKAVEHSSRRTSTATVLVAVAGATS